MKSLMPKRLFTRLLVIIMVPMVVVQIVTILVFYERHWDTVTRYMASNLSADVALIVDQYAANQTPDQFEETRLYALRYFYFELSWKNAAILEKNNALIPSNYAGNTLLKSLANRLSYPHRIDLNHNLDRFAIHVQFPDGVMVITADRKRVFSSTSLLVILWTVSTSILFFGIAVIFIRGQVRPIIRLARAARALGLGRPSPDYKLAGAQEVRLAGQAFQAMRQRIQRQLVERTEMLAGVSHDLRTPLTRMKLQLEFIPDGDEKDSIKEDIRDMESMINDYINFASHAVMEEMVDVDLPQLIKDSIDSFGLDEKRLVLTNPDLKISAMPLRQRSIRRALDNLINNAIRHGQQCQITTTIDDDQVQIIIDDDGPGIPKDQRVAVIRPFVQLNTSPKSDVNQSGAGLGLSIANDTALSHGGNLLLGDSPLGGLRVRLQLPL